MSKIKDWFKSVDVSDVVVAMLLTGFVIFLICRGCNKADASSPEATTETVAENVYEDTVFAVAVHDGQTHNSYYEYKEIIFSNDHYLYHREEGGAYRHRDFNHPVYVETGDLCVVKVEVNEDEEKVTLLRNLTKETLSETGCYWEDDRPDLD